MNIRNKNQVLIAEEAAMSEKHVSKNIVYFIMKIPVSQFQIISVIPAKRFAKTKLLQKIFRDYVRQIFVQASLNGLQFARTSWTYGFDFFVLR